MKIGVDLLRLADGPRTGIGNYTFNIVRALSEIDEVNDYTLYFKSEPAPDFLESLTTLNSKFTHKVLESSPMWTQISLSRECFHNPPDVLFSTWHTLPIRHPPKMKIVSTIHGLECQRFRSYPLFYTTYLSDRVISVSEHTKRNIMLKYFVRSSKIVTIPEGVDTTKFAKKDSNDIREVMEKHKLRGEYLFFVGTLNERKNIDRILVAFEGLLRETRVDVTLVFAGEVTKEYTYLYDKYKDDHNVMLLGSVSDHDLVCLLSGALYLVFPSVDEGFGLPILEAFACEVPVLTSNTAAMPEVGGHAVYYVDPSSTNSLQIGMKEMLLKEELRETLIQLGKERVQKFTWENAAYKTLEVFEEIHASR
jgi:glycosyltransferase involved in cell wall biosynthesis